MYHPDDNNPTRYLVIDGERVDNVENTYEFHYLNGRHSYRVEREDGSYVRVGEEYYGPYDEVSPAYLAANDLGYMYVYYQ